MRLRILTVVMCMYNIGSMVTCTPPRIRRCPRQSLLRRSPLTRRPQRTMTGTLSLHQLLLRLEPVLGQYQPLSLLLLLQQVLLLMMTDSNPLPAAAHQRPTALWRQPCLKRPRYVSSEVLLAHVLRVSNAFEVQDCNVTRSRLWLI